MESTRLVRRSNNKWQRVGTVPGILQMEENRNGRGYNSDITILVYKGTVNGCIKHRQIFRLWVYETIPTYRG